MILDDIICCDKNNFTCSICQWHRQASNTANNQHNNFKLNITLNPKNLTETEILSIAKNHSEKICRAFGLPHEYAFVNDKLSPSQMNSFYL